VGIRARCRAINKPQYRDKISNLPAFLANGGLSVKNCDYHSIRAIIGDSFERFPHSGFQNIEKGVFKA
jgi:hypothetical protein